MIKINKFKLLNTVTYKSPVRSLGRLAASNSSEFRRVELMLFIIFESLLLKVALCIRRGPSSSVLVSLALNMPSTASIMRVKIIIICMAISCDIVTLLVGSRAPKQTGGADYRRSCRAIKDPRSRAAAASGRSAVCVAWLWSR